MYTYTCFIYFIHFYFPSTSAIVFLLFLWPLFSSETALMMSNTEPCTQITTYFHQPYGGAEFPNGGKRFSAPLNRLEFAVETTGYVKLFLRDSRFVVTYTIRKWATLKFVDLSCVYPAARRTVHLFLALMNGDKTLRQDGGPRCRTISGSGSKLCCMKK